MWRILRPIATDFNSTTAASNATFHSPKSLILHTYENAKMQPNRATAIRFASRLCLLHATYFFVAFSNISIFSMLRARTFSLRRWQSFAIVCEPQLTRHGHCIWGRAKYNRHWIVCMKCTLMRLQKIWVSDQILTNAPKKWHAIFYFYISAKILHINIFRYLLSCLMLCIRSNVDLNLCIKTNNCIPFIKCAKAFNLSGSSNYASHFASSNRLRIDCVCVCDVCLAVCGTRWPMAKLRLSPFIYHSHISCTLTHA